MILQTKILTLPSSYYNQCDTQDIYVQSIIIIGALVYECNCILRCSYTIIRFLLLPERRNMTNI